MTETKRERESSRMEVRVDTVAISTKQQHLGLVVPKHITTALDPDGLFLLSGCFESPSCFFIIVLAKPGGQ